MALLKFDRLQNQMQVPVLSELADLSPEGTSLMSGEEGVGPPQGVTLTWRDVSVYARCKQDRFFRLRSSTSYKKIINNVSGALKPGSLVAVMGGSGAGKSMLMSTLAYRAPDGVVVHGDIQVNGQPVGDFMHRLSGFMHQEDLFVGSLTVREHLNFMSRMKMDRRVNDEDRRRLIHELLTQLGLDELANTRIGGRGSEKVISGGEKKRLSFATEMLTGPPLLFCDEPTTGLDSQSAQTLIRMMHVVAGQGRTVLCTIHQPSSEIFSMFSQLMLVADGRIAFFGDSKSALQFFSRLGFECPPATNPADFFIRTLALTPGAEEDSRCVIRQICNEFAVSEAAKEVELLLHRSHVVAEEVQRNAIGQPIKNPYAVVKLFWLIHRSVLSVLRDPSIQGFRLLQKIGIGLMAGLCFTGSVAPSQLGIQSVQGALFILVSENVFSPMYSVLHTFPSEMPLFRREYRSGLYPTHLYYLSKVIAMVPGLLLEPLLFAALIYYLAGLKATTQAFLTTTFITVLTINVSTACGYFFSSAFESVTLAMACLVPFDYVLMITSGLFIKLGSLPWYVSWMRFLSWLMYSNEALSIVQWEGITNITCSTEHTDLPCLTTGAEVLSQYSFAACHFWMDLMAMAILFVLFHVMAYMCLLLRAKSA
ncbi:protein scarlet isoform X2 [Bacillus rossius redtenbacheri]|uniref:protein scarlet isoform X2 n=1 Tax=Bacillus rossius redtenbacheri TaxID=93214 RepID=UPI002FDD8E38